MESIEITAIAVKKYRRKKTKSTANIRVYSVLDSLCNNPEI